MNLEEAIHAITKRGFTVRQAQFLILVARHSGVCVMRQYSTFAGIVFGQKTRKFFDKLVQSGFVATYDCAHGRGRVYHVRHRAIYDAIGEPASPAAWRAPRTRAAHAPGRHSAELGQCLDVVPRREGGLLLEAWNRDERLPASDRPARRTPAHSTLPRCSGALWARQDFPSALRGLDPPGALPSVWQLSGATHESSDEVPLIAPPVLCSTATRSEALVSGRCVQIGPFLRSTLTDTLRSSGLLGERLLLCRVIPVEDQPVRTCAKPHCRSAHA